MWLNLPHPSLCYRKCHHWFFRFSPPLFVAQITVQQPPNVSDHRRVNCSPHSCIHVIRHIFAKSVFFSQFVAVVISTATAGTTMDKEMANEPRDCCSIIFHFSQPFRNLYFIYSKIWCCHSLCCHVSISSSLPLASYRTWEKKLYGFKIAFHLSVWDGY